MAAELHIFYGDLNCPFCYAQNERLLANGGGYLLEWRGVNHMPALPVPMQPTSMDGSLETEICSLRERAPEVPISDHNARPHTALATLCIAEARWRDPVGARLFKDAIYRAFWRDGRDISTLKVLGELARSVGMAEPSDPNAFQSIVNRWHEEWESGPFDRRLPAMRSRSGGLMLGMGTRQELSNFLWTRAEVRNPNDAC